MLYGKVVTSEARIGKRESPGEKRNVFSRDLKTVRESLLTTVFDSEVPALTVCIEMALI